MSGRRIGRIGQVAERRGQAGQQERRQPLQQPLVVGVLVGPQLFDQLENVGPGQRVRQGAHDEVQAPTQFALRKLRQRAAERGLEAGDHRRVLFGEELADERRRVGIGAAQQAQKIAAAAFGVPCKQQRGDQHRRQDLLARHRVGRRRLLERGEQIDPRLVHRIEPARQHRLEQLFLAAEVVVDRSKVHPGGSGDQPQRRRLEAVLHEQRLRGIEEPLLGDGRATRGAHWNHRAMHRDRASCPPRLGQRRPLLAANSINSNNCFNPMFV